MMLVEMRTVAQAARVVERTGGLHLPGQPAPDGTARLSRRVQLDDVESHRAEIESVSVLFSCFEADGTGGWKPAASGWRVEGAVFEVFWPQDQNVVRSHFGARRFAYNWALATVKADLDAMAKSPDASQDKPNWDLAGLRKRWNQQKHTVAPWWESNSKEAYASGIADLARALSNWRASRSGKRKGAKVGFPRFKSRRTDRARVRFSTGAMRLEDDRRSIVVPVIGTLRSKENTRRVQRLLAKGQARILSMTVSERWGRLFVSVSYARRLPSTRAVSKPGVRAGVDLGLRSLAMVADTEGNMIEFPNPAPLRATLAERRRLGRQMSRRIPGSIGYRAAKAKLARLDRRAVYLRREAWHQLTSMLAATYSDIVVEDLDLAAMKRSMGRRAFRRSVSDAALGMFRPMLAYKAERSGASVVVADRWFPSSQLHHGCGCRLQAPTRLAKQLVCTRTGELVDRDRNAARNLRDWTESTSQSWTSWVQHPRGYQGRTSGTDPGSDHETTRDRRSAGKTCAQAPARRVEVETKTPQGERVA